MLVQQVVEINAPVEKAFVAVDDPEQLKRWMDGLEETTYLGEVDRTNPVGTRFKQKIREGGKVQEYEGEVLAYEKNQRLCVRVGNACFDVKVDYRFTPTPSGTRLDYSADLNCKTWLMKVMMFLFSFFTRGVLRKQMAKLKQVAEAG